MRSPMVSVDPHEQRTAVCVPQPGRHGRNIYASLDCGRGEGITQIMMRQQPDAEFLAPLEGSFSEFSPPPLMCVFQR
jgi:hypothetical protein